MRTKTTHGQGSFRSKDVFFQDGGFSLIEILVSIVVLMVPLMGIASLAGLAINGNNYSKERTSASVLMASRFDSLKNRAATDFDHSDLASGVHTDYLDQNGSLVAQGSSQGVYTRMWNVIDDVVPANLKTITMTISWVRNGATKSISQVAKISR